MYNQCKLTSQETTFITNKETRCFNYLTIFSSDIKGIIHVHKTGYDVMILMNIIGMARNMVESILKSVVLVNYNYMYN